MNKVRIGVKEIMQPPINTPASISHQTIDVESGKLHDLLADNKRAYDDKKHKHSTFQVIGAEAIMEETDETSN